MFRSASPRALGTIGRICCAALCLLLLVGISPGAAGADTSVGRWYWETNSHYYELFYSSSGLNWGAAKVAAESHAIYGNTGHLVTITSSEESEFVRVSCLSGLGEAQVFLGGYQPSGSPEPAGNWQWITGETWSYTNWCSDQPTNTNGNENVLVAYCPSQGKWNDISEFEMWHYYIVEYDAPLIQDLYPSAYTTGTLSIGAKPYVDRSWMFVSPLPSDLEGLLYIKTLDMNQSSASEVQMQFTATRAVTIYVGLDNRINPRPSWLDLWKETNMTLHVYGDLSEERKVFSKRYPPGLVQLYGNRPVGVSTGSMYTPIIDVSEDFSGGDRPAIAFYGDHGYEIVSVPAGITWLEAQSAAEQHLYWGKQGHLATITSLAESEFVRASCFSGISGNVHIGGYQPPSSPEPDGNWQWITGETWTFTNWNSGEPNNGLSGQNRLVAIAPDGKWDDINDVARHNYYLVEYDDLPSVSVLSPDTGYSSGRLYSGSPIYSDGENRFYEPIPAFLRGQIYITTRNADRSSTEGSFLLLDLSDALTVYVAYDDYRTSRPSWLSTANGWQLLPMRLETDDLHPYRTICFKHFPQGVAVLGANRDTGQIADNSMYTVILGGPPPLAGVEADVWSLYQ